MDTETHNILDHGEVQLVDTMPHTYGAGDQAIVDAARVSYAKGTTRKRGNEKLINYLMKNKHTSPFEMVELKFYIKAPIFVLRQWHRHRTASINEESARYSEVCGDFYVPTPDRIQGQDSGNKQGSDGVPLGSATAIRQQMDGLMYQAHNNYQDDLSIGVARETARTVLPQSMYSSMVWKINLLNFFRFSASRMDEHAQWEIRQYAKLMFELARPVAPLAFEAFEEHWLHAMTISRSDSVFYRDTRDE